MSSTPKARRVLLGWASGTLLVVLAVFVVIVRIPAVRRARLDQTRLNIESLERRLDLYRSKVGLYPATGVGFAGLLELGIISKQPRDAWGNPYLYSLVGGRPLITSYGADGRPGGDGYRRRHLEPSRRGLLPLMARRPHRGFTLIELMVALAVAASLFGVLVLGLGALTGARARKAMGELGAAARSLYDTAALTGNTCRLVLLLPRDDSAEFAYRAECATGPVTTSMDRDQEIRDATKAAVEAYRKGNRGGGRSTNATPDPKTASGSSGHGSYGSSGSALLDVLDAEKARVEKAAAFSAFTTSEIEPRKMSGVRVSVWTSHQKAKIDSGLAYLYFFPQGYTERAQVTVRQGKNVWTLLVSPLTGKTSIVDGEPEVPKS